MTISVEELATQMPAVTAYKVVITGAQNLPPAPPAELQGLGKEIFEQLERENP